jgi:hypothetical protein
MTRMNQPGSREIQIRFQNLIAVSVTILLGFFSIATTASADPKIRCGSPTKSDGKVTITITLQRGDETHIIVMRDIMFNQGYPPADKANFIAELITQGEDPNHTWITATHADGSDEVQLHGENGWSIAGHAIGQDGTGEPDWVTYDGISTGSEGLCSLSGTATGTSPQGGPGMVGIQAFGAHAQLATPPGMPAQVVEAMLMQQLMSQGVPVRWAQPGDFVGPFSGMQHDESVLFISPPNANSLGALYDAVADDGLQLDLMAIADPPDPASRVAPASGVQSLRLEVSPSVFSLGPVAIRYASPSRAGLVRLTAHDALGRCLGLLFEGSAGGAGSLRWDGRDQDHRPLPGGVYFLRLETPNGTMVRRVTRIR